MLPLSQLTISKPWVIWACSALLEGASRQQILQILIQNGADATESESLLNVAIQSPIMEAALSGYSRARRETHRLKDQLYEIASKDVHQEFPTPEAFHNVYLAHNVPIHIPGFCANSPALKAWNTERLKLLIGDLNVEVCKGRQADKNPDRHFQKYLHTLQMSEYIDLVEAGSGNDLYMIARNNNFTEFCDRLWGDLIFPEHYFSTERAKKTSSFWYGPKSTHTLTHHDTTNILFCQIWGQKTFWLSPPENILIAAEASSYYASSQLSVLSNCAEKCSQHHIFKATLNPGDALLIPVGWWHEVLSLSTSISIGITGLLFENRYVEYHPAPLASSQSHGSE